jgi:molecular chaperone DnaK
MQYIGIDLGTTNSAICSYDGENVRLYKSSDQNDVTPSAVFFDKRGNKHVGARAYDNLARDPGSVATAFKRLMGTSTPINLSSLNKALTPEECSAEILKALFGYLPEDIRNDPETGTVITVPAAFNQMQKDATMSASVMAGLGQVALMQEPVAAVMSVMRHRSGDGIFIVYDLGGGTLDVAIAESLSGHVSLLAHGGAAMKGGRNFDRLIFDHVLMPWLSSNFHLPKEFSSSQQFQRVQRTGLWAAEKAKIELSSRESSVISAAETDILTRDLNGKELYFDIPIDRSKLDELITSQVEESVQAVRETMEKANLTSCDIERIVFVGGPTQYKPLRDQVSQRLAIAASTDVNPMTAVAEGAAIFAESIDWCSQSRGRKNSRGEISAEGPLDLVLKYVARTPSPKAKIVVDLIGSTLQGVELQIDSLDTGWSSGKMPLNHAASIEVNLSKPGENLFKVFVFDTNGGPIELATNRICITRTAATVDAIPSSSSIGVEALDRIGGRPTLQYLIQEGEPLPKKGKFRFKAEESLRSGSHGALNFKIWEGGIKAPITDNEFIGLFSVKGTDFEDGVIPAGADLIFDYEVLDSGNIHLNVSVPSVGGAFSARNYYSRQAGEIDYTQASKHILNESRKLRERLQAFAQKISDNRIDAAFEKLDRASELKQDADPENAKLAMNDVQDAKKMLAEIRERNLKEIRQIDLEKCIRNFDNLRELARPTEISSFENLVVSARRALDAAPPQFETLLGQMWGKIFGVLIRQDWWIVDRFKWLEENSHVFPDKNQHAELIGLGKSAIQSDDIEKLRQIVALLDALRIDASTEEEMLAATNIVKA